MWPIIRAREWLMQCAIDHAQECFYVEAGELLRHATTMDIDCQPYSDDVGVYSELDFRDLIGRVLEWNEDDIDDAVASIIKEGG
jgi:hypothetical protein